MPPRRTVRRRVTEGASAGLHATAATQHQRDDEPQAQPGGLWALASSKPAGGDDTGAPSTGASAMTGTSPQLARRRSQCLL